MFTEIESFIIKKWKKSRDDKHMVAKIPANCLTVHRNMKQLKVHRIQTWAPNGIFVPSFGKEIEVIPSFMSKSHDISQSQ